MLQIIIRETKAYYAFAKRPVLNYMRKSAFPSSQATSARVVDQSMSNLGYSQNDANVHQNASQIINFVDFSKSKGNYIVDADGNTMLDASANGELNPLGYNHDLHMKAISGAEFDNSIINGFAADQISSANFEELVKETLGSVAPGAVLDGVTLVNAQNATGQAV